MTTPVAEVRAFTVTIPANTPATAPATTDITMPAREVAWVKWRVPPGPSGLMSWQLTMSGGQVVIPAGGGYITADDDGGTWEMFGQPDSGAWELTGYNTDIYDHSVYLYFGVTVPGQTAPPATLIDNAALSSPPAVTVPPGVAVPAAVTVPPVTVPAVSVPGG